MRPIVIVQARTSSSRFPRKVLADIHGKPMLQHVVERAQQIKGIAGLVIATTDRYEDDVVLYLARKLGVPCSRGSRDDVLERYYLCAKDVAAGPIIRITGDCPLLNPEVSSGVLAAYLAGGYEYVSNVGPETDGWDTEVFSFRALAWSHKEATDPRDREHVTTYMRRELAPGLSLRKITQTIPGAAKWSVDTADDLARVRNAMAVAA